MMPAANHTGALQSLLHDVQAARVSTDQAIRVIRKRIMPALRADTTIDEARRKAMLKALRGVVSGLELVILTRDERVQ